MLSDTERELDQFYDDLNEDGQNFIDCLAKKFMTNYEKKPNAKPFGIKSARHLVIRTLQYLPEVL